MINVMIQLMSVLSPRARNDPPRGLHPRRCAFRLADRHRVRPAVRQQHDGCGGIGPAAGARQLGGRGVQPEVDARELGEGDAVEGAIEGGAVGGERGVERRAGVERDERGVVAVGGEVQAGDEVPRRGDGGVDLGAAGAGEVAHARRGVEDEEDVEAGWDGDAGGLGEGDGEVDGALFRRPGVINPGDVQGLGGFVQAVGGNLKHRAPIGRVGEDGFKR